MTPGPARRRLLAAAALFVALPIASVEASASASARPRPGASHVSPGHVVIDTTGPHWPGGPADGGPSLVTIDAFERSLARNATTPATSAGQVSSSRVGRFVACYEGTVPSDVRLVVDRSLARWDDALLLTGPDIEIDIVWTELGSASTLAASGPRSFVIDDELPKPGVRYPVALANELTGYDFSPGAECDPDTAGDVIVYINSRFGGEANGWHLGPGAPPEDAIDLETVMLHEIGHGLGFLGSAAVFADGSLVWPHDGGQPYVFETFLRRCSHGADCTSGASQPITTGDATALTESDLWFGPANSPVLKLFAPPKFNTGSSLSHFDETWYPKGTEFSLLTPFVGRGEWHRAVDRATLTAAQAMGWPLATTPAAPIVTTATAGNATALLDVAVPDLSEAVPPVDYVAEVWRNGFFEQSVHLPSVPAQLQNLVNGDTYHFVLRGTSAAGVGPPSEATQPIRPLELPPFSTAENFARSMIEGLWGRPATATEVEALAAQARAADSLVELIADLGGHPDVEHRRRITRLYLGFFQRRPDVGGLRFWTSRSHAGESLERIALHFATATEFEQGAEVDDRTFVTAAYERVLGRSPDAGGLAYWERQLQTGLDRGRLLLLFSESPEHVGQTGPASEIVIVFDALLGRMPSDSETAEWVPIVAEDGIAALVGSLISSDEFDAA